jgi:hypothetical protein
MAHLATCRTRKELTGNIWTYYSEPDASCTDESHNRFYTQENQ